jgi:hypothetical protein
MLLGPMSISAGHHFLPVSLCAALLFAVGADAAAPPAAARPELTPHRAIYSMKLAASRSGSAMADARGAMYVEWAESCDGWTVTQRVRLTLVTGEGDDSETESNYSSWESKDGRNYRFTMRSLRDGGLVEELRGDAAVGAAGSGSGGEARFTMPADSRFALPKGAVFPTEHTLQLIEAAQAGASQLSRVIFDGASLDGPLEVNAVIGAPVEAGLPTAGASELTAGRSWRMRLAFYPVSSQAATPDYEVGVRLYANGVADAFLLDYGSYSVAANLEKLEALPRPRC